MSVSRGKSPIVYYLCVSVVGGAVSSSSGGQRCCGRMGAHGTCMPTGGGTLIKGDGQRTKGRDNRKLET
jgi:hypothetical protein